MHHHLVEPVDKTTFGLIADLMLRFHIDRLYLSCLIGFLCRMHANSSFPCLLFLIGLVGGVGFEDAGKVGAGTIY